MWVPFDTENAKNCREKFFRRNLFVKFYRNKNSFFVRFVIIYPNFSYNFDDKRNCHEKSKILKKKVSQECSLAFIKFLIKRLVEYKISNIKSKNWSSEKICQVVKPIFLNFTHILGCNLGDNIADITKVTQ